LFACFCVFAVGLIAALCAESVCGLSRRGRLTTGFLQGADVLRDSSTAACRSGILAGTGGTKAAFFCLLFFAAAKKSRCRPAQGQRMKHRYEFADATAAKTQKPDQQLRRRRKNLTY
jgi:hypothetical protein